jgi:nitroimidazol reductase NimA-like FMN-containing flavoprotein (pyridoxamine 5'-phosphate oxidase superfamily)
MVELGREECLELLADMRFGRLAVAIGDGPPAIRPINYVFDTRSQSVVFRTAPGSKLHGLISSSHASFEIDGIDEQTRTGWSVIIQGVAEEITDKHELVRLADAGLDPWVSSGGHWARIRAFTVSGRRLGLSKEEDRSP